MGSLVSNNGVGTLASSMSDSTTTLVLNSGQGALFPSPGAGEYFYVTIYNDANTKEIVKCTARAVNTLTVVRAQDGTTAAAWLGGDRVELRPIRAVHANLAQKDSTNTFTADQVIEGDLTVEEVNAQEVTSEAFAVADDAGTSRPIDFRSGTDLRFKLQVTSTAEDGSNGGSDLALDAYANDGVTIIGRSFKVDRKTAIMTALAGFMIGANKGDAFPTGTKMVFAQASPPAGWVQDTSRNDRVMRVVSTAGGGTGGSWTISGVAVAGHALSIAEMPVHSHGLFCSSQNFQNGDQEHGFSNQPRNGAGTSSTAGSGTAHNHELTVDGTWRPSYLDVIVATKG